MEGLAWSAHGPLKDCPLCLQFAKISIDAIVGADINVAKCVRKIVFPAISREGGECLNETIEGWGGNPEYPDFEAESMKNPKTA